MPRLLKIILGAFGVAVLLVVVAVAAILVLVDPADYKDEITAAVEKETGRSARIEGDISLSLFPTLGLAVEQISLGNPPGFATDSFLEIGSAAIGARVMPLLSRRLEVTTLRLEGLRVNLLRRADGSANWDGLGGSGEDAGRGGPAQPGQAQGELGRIAGLEVRDVQVRYEDQATGRVVVAGIPRLSTGAIVPGEPVPLEAEATLDLDQGALRMTADLATVLAAPTGGTVAELRDLDLQVEASGEAVPGGTQTARLTVPELALDGSRQALDLPTAVLEAVGVRATLALAGEALGTAPKFSGRFEVAEFSPRRVLESLGQPALETSDPKALGRAALATDLEFAAGKATLEGLRATLDDSTLTGRLVVAGGDVTRITGRLALDQIDLDRYTAPSSESEAPATGGEEELAFDWLHALAMDLGVELGSLRVSGLQLGPVNARAVADGGRLVVQPLTAGLYQGQSQGRLELDARRSPATFRLQDSLAGLQVQPFVSDLADFNRLTGIADLEANLSTSATTTGDLLRGLNGSVGFKLSDGALAGINLWYEIQRAYALARQQPVPEKLSPDTQFRQLQGTAVIRDGKLVNDDLSGGLPMLAVAGSGAIDLAARTLDYNLTATVLREAVDPATGERSELAGARIPLRLSGDLTAPKVSVDVEELLKDRATEEIKERLRDPLEKLRQRLRPDG